MICGIFMAIAVIMNIIDRNILLSTARIQNIIYSEVIFFNKEAVEASEYFPKNPNYVENKEAPDASNNEEIDGGNNNQENHDQENNDQENHDQENNDQENNNQENNDQENNNQENNNQENNDQENNNQENNNQENNEGNNQESRRNLEVVDNANSPEHVAGGKKNENLTNYSLVIIDTDQSNQNNVEDKEEQSMN